MQQRQHRILFTDRDDFNEERHSDQLGAPGGRGGQCFASNYRNGATYLLLLKKAPTIEGALNLYWSPLSRLNDQVRTDKDEWVAWVRNHLR